MEDLIFYAQKVHHFEPNFIPAGLHFAQYNLNERDTHFTRDRNTLVQALLSRVITHADELPLNTLAYAFKTSRIVSKDTQLDLIKTRK